VSRLPVIAAMTTELLTAAAKGGGPDAAFPPHAIKEGSA
jgi:hypothetical protein